MPLNYSKWDNIELSDDEDNFHPNIDNNLMIRLQREKREQREQEEAMQRDKLEAQGDAKSQEEILKLDRMKKFHVGNICSDKFNSKHEKSSASDSAVAGSKNTVAKVKIAATDEQSFSDGYSAFLEEHRPMLDEYAAIDEDDEKSEAYVLAHTELLSEHATGFYLLHCINLQVEGKTREMRKCSRQYLLLTYVCDLAKSMPGRDARDAIRPLFKKMLMNQQAHEAFTEHLEKYVAHVKTRAEVKKKEMLEEMEAEGEDEYEQLQKGEQVGPGGLDPAEVFETLPKVLQEAFGERSVEALKEAIATLSNEDAGYHMQRCIDSGLWDPKGNEGAVKEEEAGPAGDPE